MMTHIARLFTAAIRSGLIFLVSWLASADVAAEKAGEIANWSDTIGTTLAAIVVFLGPLLWTWIKKRRGLPATARAPQRHDIIKPSGSMGDTTRGFLLAFLIGAAALSVPGCASMAELRATSQGIVEEMTLVQDDLAAKRAELAADPENAEAAEDVAKLEAHLAALRVEAEKVNTVIQGSEDAAQVAVGIGGVVAAAVGLPAVGAALAVFGGVLERRRNAPGSAPAPGAPGTTK